jgi:hypothetical protein
VRAGDEGVTAPWRTLYLRNAGVLTGDPARPQARAVVVAGGRIAAVGSDVEVTRAAGPATETIDCGGSTVVPGFIDAHVHLLALARSLSSADISPGRVASIAALCEVLRARRRQGAGGGWIRAHGYDECYLRERRHPTRWDLDAAVPDQPVRLRHRTRHASVLNSAGLAWVEDRAPALLRTPGVERGVDGRPTGVLYDLDRALSPLMPKASAAELRAALAQASTRLLAAGVTAVDDASATTGPAEAGLIRGALADGLIRQRVRLLWGIRDHGLPPDDSAIGGVKLMLDERGGRDREFEDALDAAHRAGLQVAVHAVEGTALAVALEAFETVLTRWPRRHRHRLEHCALCPPALADRVAALGLAVVAQPGFLRHVGERYVTELSAEARGWLQPLRSLVSRGVRVAGSSDAPVGPFDPLVGIAAAVGRETRSGVRLTPTEALSLGGALDLYTGAGAYVTCSEGAHGRIAVGRRADLLLLSDDVTRLPAARLDTVRVLLVVQGERCTIVDPVALGDGGGTTRNDRPFRIGSRCA